MSILVRASVILVLALAVLPERPSAWAGASGLSASSLRLSLPSFQPRGSAHQGVRRALVMEPFAWQMGPSAGVEEIRVLKAAGFQVDTLYNEQVTIQAMKSMSKYDVVYIHTHGGVNDYGEAVIESGQPVLGPDPTLDQMIKDYEVFTTPIAGGNDTKYYGIMSRFILHYMGQFPSNSMLVVNTCSLLKAWLFWKALQFKGLSTLVSYDEEPTLPDALQAGDRLFDDLGTGINISQAIAHANGAAQYGVGPPGYGVTKRDPNADYVGDATGVAHLGYLGDGLVTLQGRSAGPLAAPAYASPTPTPTPAPTSAATSTPTPTPTRPSAPTPTPTPTSTSTSTPPPALLPLQVSLNHSVAPGSTQVISVRSLPHIPAHFQIAYPNGDVQQADLTTDAQGSAAYAYVQRASKIVLHRYTAHMRVTVSSGTRSRSFRRTYRIGFGRIDVSVTLPPVQGEPVHLWIHTHPHTRVTAALFLGSALLGRLTAVTGQHGWGHLRYRAPAVHSVLSRRRVLVRAWAEDGGRTVGTRTYFVMP